MFIAIEAATDTGSIAVGSGRELAGEFIIGSYTKHAETLLPALDFLLHHARIDRSAITGVVAGAGPGSFTGVRIAAATARGLAHGLGVPLRAYSSLAALALEGPAGRAVCALFDARRSEVYAACYERDAHTDVMRCLLAPTVLGVHELRARLGSAEPLYVGEGAQRYARELGIPEAPAAVPRASSLLRLAAADPGAGLVATGSEWEPSYIRASGAERGIAG